MSETPLKAKVIVKIPQNDPKFRAGNSYREPRRRRDSIQALIRSNAQRIQSAYGVRIDVSKEGNDLIIVEVPLFVGQEVDSENFRKMLMSGTDWLYSIETEIPEANGEIRRVKSGGGGVPGEVYKTLAEFQSIGRTPADIRSVIDKNEESILMAQITMEDLSNKIHTLENTRVEPANLTLEQLSLLEARSLAGNSYQACAQEYEKNFPGGLEEDLRLALESDLKKFVLTPELIEMCSPQGAAINLDQTIEDILREAHECSGSFYKSGYHQAHRIEYAGAIAIINASKNAAKDREIEKDLLDEAKKIKESYEDEKEHWSEKMDLSFKALKEMRERVENYKIARDISPTKMLNIEVPVFVYSYVHGKGRDFYVILPTDKTTENTNFTRALRWDLMHSIRESIGTKKDSKITLKDVFDSKIVEFFIPNAIDPASEASLEILLPGIKKNYENHSLSKLGVDIRVYSRGEI